MPQFSLAAAPDAGPRRVGRTAAEARAGTPLTGPTHR